MTQRSYVGVATIGCVMVLGLFRVPGPVRDAGAGAVQGSTSAEFQFVAHTIATGMTGGYQAVVTDLNRDQKPDVIGVTTGLDELRWYENPGWQPHVIASGLNRTINLAAADLDGDGIPELAIAHEFGTSHERSLGVLSLLSHQGDPTQPWSVREIDRTPTAHRVRWADIEGNGRKVLVNSPLVGPGAVAPDYRDAVPIFWYRPDDWSRQVLTDSEEGVVHGILAAPWDGADRDAVLSAGFLGVHVHRFVDGQWIRTAVTSGDPAEWPLSGSSEVELGRLGNRTFMTTIEPWHGGQVVVYREDDGPGTDWWSTPRSTAATRSRPVISTVTGRTKSWPATGATRGASICTLRSTPMVRRGHATWSTMVTLRRPAARSRISTPMGVSTLCASAARPRT